MTDNTRTYSDTSCIVILPHRRDKFLVIIDDDYKWHVDTLKMDSAEVERVEDYYFDPIRVTAEQVTIVDGVDFTTASVDKIDELELSAASSVNYSNT